MSQPQQSHGSSHAPVAPNEIAVGVVIGRTSEYFDFFVYGTLPLFLVDLLKGLWVTLKYTPQPAFTFQYPAERRPVAPRFRGVLRLQVEPETGAQTCIVCDQKARKVDNGRCIECYNKEYNSKNNRLKVKPHIDRLLANDPIDW